AAPVAQTGQTALRSLPTALALHFISLGQSLLSGNPLQTGDLAMVEGEVVHRLTERSRLSRWLRRFPPRLVWASFVFFNGFSAVAALAGLAVLSHPPFVFPSVGPTAFLLYFMPTAPTASPRNTLCGHAIGIGCGYAALCLLGLQHGPSALLEGIHWP